MKSQFVKNMIKEMPEDIKLFSSIYAELTLKINETLPKLKELTDGAIIYKPHYNVFSQKYVEDVYDEIEYRFGKFFENETRSSDNI